MALRRGGPARGAADVLPDREQDGAHMAGSCSLARRHGFLDERTIVVAIVFEAQGASFDHPPILLDHLRGSEFERKHGMDVLCLRAALEETFENFDYAYDLRIFRQPADLRIDRQRSLPSRAVREAPSQGKATLHEHHPGRDGFRRRLGIRRQSSESA